MIEAILAFAPPTILGSIIFYTHRKQYIQQNRIASATLMTELIKPWEDNQHPKFQKFVSDFMHNRLDDYNDNHIRMFLDRMDYIAMFYKDEAITTHQIRTMFGPLIEQIRENKKTQEYLTTKKSDYSSLCFLLDASEDWYDSKSSSDSKL